MELSACEEESKKNQEKVQSILERKLTKIKDVNVAISFLDEKFFILSKLEIQGRENLIFPNGFIFEGYSKESINKICAYMKKKGAPVEIIDFAKFDDPDKLMSHIADAGKAMKKYNHGIIAFKNFEKCAVSSEANYRFIGSLKGWSCDSVKSHKVTKVAFVENVANIDVALNGYNRFESENRLKSIKKAP